MSTAVQLDLDLLNELLDNQKLLDNDEFNHRSSVFDDSDLFDTPIIEEDPFLNSSLTFSDPALGISNKYEGLDLVDFQPNQDLSFSFDDDMFDDKSRSMVSMVVPVAMEVALISFGIIYFS
jgi:hypothetical protein